MAAELGERQSLPIACSLGAADGAQRLAEWRRVVADALVHRTRTAGRLVLTFRDAELTAAELERLVAAERDCCGFLNWRLIRTGATLELEIAGEDDELKALSLAE